MRRNSKKENIMIKSKPVVAALSFSAFIVLTFLDLMNYFVPVIFANTGDSTRLIFEMILLVVGIVCAGGKQPRWWNEKHHHMA